VKVTTEKFVRIILTEEQAEEFTKALGETSGGSSILDDLYDELADLGFEKQEEIYEDD
jgi:hypothetical protein